MRSASLESKRREKRTLRSRVGGYLRRTRGIRSVHFIHIGKTGGTALRNTLNDYDFGDKTIVRFHSHNVTLKDIPRGEGVFFVIRDPVSRFVSAFYSRQREGKPSYFRPWTEGERRAFSRFESPAALVDGLRSDDQLVRAYAEEAMSEIEHVEDFYWDWFGDEQYLTRRMKDIFFVGTQENLEQDFEVLKDRLSVPEQVKLPQDEARAHRAAGNMPRILEEEDGKILKNWYAQDFDFIELLKRKLTDPCVFPSRGRIDY